jgi:hypothetical protein
LYHPQLKARTGAVTKSACRPREQVFSRTVQDKGGADPARPGQRGPRSKRRTKAERSGGPLSSAGDDRRLRRAIEAGTAAGFRGTLAREITGERDHWGERSLAREITGERDHWRERSLAREITGERDHWRERSLAREQWLSCSLASEQNTHWIGLGSSIH